jgi:hypothetical protein
VFCVPAALENTQSLVDAVPAAIDKITDLLADKEPGENA